MMIIKLNIFINNNFTKFFKKFKRFVTSQVINEIAFVNIYTTIDTIN